MSAALLLASGHHTSGFGLLPVGIVMLLVGSLNVAKPDWSWRTRRWQYKNKEAMEPSAAALRVTRIVGAVGIVAGVVLIVIAITKLS